MSRTRIFEVTLEADDPVPVGSTDWAAVDALSEDQVMARALADPDAQPLGPAELARMRRATALTDVRALRARLGLTQEEFAAAFALPLGTLRDWEQSRKLPDAPARALLRVIARDPDAVRRALAG